MRPFTKELLGENSRKLTQKGWLPGDQQRCFKKADALLDYIAKIKPGEYMRGVCCKRLNPQRIEGFRYCLEKGMPSKKMQKLSLEIVHSLLLMGDELLAKAAWLYLRSPVLFKAKYASSVQAFQKDIHECFDRGHVVPENSFEPFKTGENPVLNRSDAFGNRCVELYTDPIFESEEFQEYRQKRQSKDPYVIWIRKYKAGKRYISEKGALNRVIEQLVMAKEVDSKVNKTLAIQSLRLKKQKT